MNPDKFQITLPFPPSVNSYWGIRVVKSRGRSIPQRFINEPGKKFRRDVLTQFMVENIRTKLEGPLSCSVDLYPPTAARRDVDNFQKGVLDALDHAGLYDDDSQIIELHVRMHPKKPPGSVVVTLWEISDMQTAHSQMALVG